MSFNCIDQYTDDSLISCSRPYEPRLFVFQQNFNSPPTWNLAYRYPGQLSEIQLIGVCFTKIRHRYFVLHQNVVPGTRHHFSDPLHVDLNVERVVSFVWRVTDCSYSVYFFPYRFFPTHEFSWRPSHVLCPSLLTRRQSVLPMTSSAFQRIIQERMTESTFLFLLTWQSCAKSFL